MKKSTSAFLMFAFLLAAFSNSFAQPAISYQLVKNGFDKPCKIAFTGAGDTRMFICENAGKIKIISNGNVLATPFLDLTGKTDLSAESGGLLSMVFHPQFASNGYFFVIYTEKKSTLTTSGAITLSRFHVSSANPNVADTAEKVLMKIPKPITYGIRNLEHNGSDLHFGKDGNLYISVGDGNSWNPGDPLMTSQNEELLFGKLLRINVNNFNTPPYYTIPLFNPYYLGKANNARKEIYCMGLRNPYRWSFDKLNGDIYIGDVGEDKWEEINYTSAATQLSAAAQWAITVIFGLNKRQPVANYGWSCFEGNDRYVNFSRCDSTRNFTFPIYQYTKSTPTVRLSQAVVGGFVYRGSQYPSLYGYYLFGEFFFGDIYFMKKDNSGQWQTTIQRVLPRYISTFGEDPNGELYTASIVTGEVFKIVVNSAAVNARTPVPLATVAANEEPTKVYPTLLTSPSFKVALNKPASLLQITTVDGEMVYQQSLKNQSGTITINAPIASKGLHLVKIYTASGVETHKLVIQ